MADTVTTASGLQYEDEIVGDGASPEAGRRVMVHYTGTFKDGRKFDSSRDRNEPFEFVIGRGQVIKGWDEGIIQLSKGERAKLVVSPDYGYGAKGAAGVSLV